MLFQAADNVDNGEAGNTPDYAREGHEFTHCDELREFLVEFFGSEAVVAVG